MERRRLKAVKPGDDYVTRRDPLTYVTGNGAVPGDVYARLIGRLYKSPAVQKAVTGIEDELHDIRIELKNHGELFERIAVALETLAKQHD